jgi:hypothetical protein
MATFFQIITNSNYYGINKNKYASTVLVMQQQTILKNSSSISLDDIHMYSVESGLGLKNSWLAVHGN